MNMVVDRTTASSGTRSVTRSVTRADLNAKFDAPSVSGDIQMSSEDSLAMEVCHNGTYNVTVVVDIEKC